MRILLVEDDIRLTEHLIQSLRDRGHSVAHAQSPEELVEVLNAPGKPDLVIMDRLLGSVDSKSYFNRVKSRWPEIPVLILSAISTPNEKVELLNMGADDYLGKPFSTSELVARVNVLLRRRSSATGQFLQVGNAVVDIHRRSVSVEGREEILPSKEFLLLRTLCQEPGRVWSKSDLLDNVWGQAVDVNTNVVEATITNVRKKLDDMGSNVQIKNLRNAGYCVEAH